MPRWKIIDGSEDPIMDLTVMFRGDSVPEGFTKVCPSYLLGRTAR
jgi:hypothetical protein